MRTYGLQWLFEEEWVEPTAEDAPLDEREPAIAAV